MRRIPNRCYLCGDPTVDEWFCVAHLWAVGCQHSPQIENGLGKITREHAFWVERLAPQQIVELASHLNPEGVAA